MWYEIECFGNNSFNLPAMGPLAPLLYDWSLNVCYRCDIIRDWSHVYYNGNFVHHSALLRHSCCSCSVWTCRLINGVGVAMQISIARVTIVIIPICSHNEDVITFVEMKVKRKRQMLHPVLLKHFCSLITWVFPSESFNRNKLTSNDNSIISD